MAIIIISSLIFAFPQTCHDKMVATRCKTHDDLNAMVHTNLQNTPDHLIRQKIFRFLIIV